MQKNNVYNGEVVGFTAGKMFSNHMDIIHVEFETQDEAEQWCESMSDLDSVSVYFPIKLTALSNTYVKEKSYD